MRADRSRDLPTLRGHVWTGEDMHASRRITPFMTRFRVHRQEDQLADARSFLAPMVADGMVRIADNELQLTETGRPFLRDAAVFVEHRLWTKEPDRPIFSKAV
jgi:oxygen-independent coproporphyrinogen-3 oxidase